jgi:hypothetical protein
MPDGLVRVWVHARDIAGNWGSFTSADLVLDRTTPTVDAFGAAVVSPTPEVLLSAHDVLSNGSASGLVGAEWFVGADPGEGKGTPVTLAATSASTFPGPPNVETVQNYTLTGLPTGVVHVRVVDAAGNWSAVVTATL